MQPLGRILSEPMRHSGVRTSGALHRILTVDPRMSSESARSLRNALYEGTPFCPKMNIEGSQDLAQNIN